MSTDIKCGNDFSFSKAKFDLSKMTWNEIGVSHVPSKIHIVNAAKYDRSVDKSRIC